MIQYSSLKGLPVTSVSYPSLFSLSETKKDNKILSLDK